MEKYLLIRQIIHQVRIGLSLSDGKRIKIIHLRHTFSEQHSSENSSFDDDDVTIDVTIPLQCLIRNSKLKLQESSKVNYNNLFINIKLLMYNKIHAFQSDLPGFYDPCVGEDKKLKIEYTYREKSYHIILSDTEPVQLPIGNY